VVVDDLADLEGDVVVDEFLGEEGADGVGPSRLG
jgi:hypothetical protein